jgi:hypothetical protein
MPFGAAAEALGELELADYAFRQGYDALKVAGTVATFWQAARARMRLAGKRWGPESTTDDLLTLLTLAQEAAGGLAEDRAPEPIRAKVRGELEAVANIGIGYVRRAPPPDRRRIATALSGLFRRMADGTAEDDPRIADLDLRMAIWWWLAAEDQTDSDTLEMAAGRFATAWHSARRTRNFRTESYAAAWFRRHGLPLPEPELAEPEDDG